MATPASYALVRALSRFLLRLFYGRIDVVGAGRIPRAGPLIIASNHHNSVVDAMLLVAVTQRRLRTLANAPLFHHPLIGPFLRLLGALPVHRRQEGGDDPARNAGLFAATTATLQARGAILIFPEGRTQPEPVLLTLRSGAARMLLAAEAAGAADVVLLPVGLVYHAPGTFRTARALVLVGEPVPTADVRVMEVAGQPEDAARLVTNRLTAALRALIVEADDRRTLQLLELVEDLWHEESGLRPADEKARIEWLQRAMQTYRVVLGAEPGRLAALRSELESFARDMDAAGLAVRQLSHGYEAGVVARFAVREGLSLLLAAPLAALGIVVHVVPYQLTAAAVRLLDRTAEEEATDKIAAGFLLYPLAWAAEAFLVLRVAGSWALAAFLIALLPLGFFALGWRARLDRVGRELRAFVRLVGDRGLPQRLRERRRALAAELRALARFVPELWPE